MRTNRFLKPFGLTDENVFRLLSGKKYRKQQKTEQGAGQTASAPAIPFVAVIDEDGGYLIVPQYSQLPATAPRGTLALLNEELYIYINRWVNLNQHHIGFIPIVHNLPEEAEDGYICFYNSELYLHYDNSWISFPSVIAHVGNQPTSPEQGDLWFSGGVLYVYNNGWQPVLAVVSVGTQPPSNPVSGQLFYNNNENRLYVYQNGWKPCDVVTYGSEFPANPFSGMAFYHTTNKALYVYLGNIWVRSETVSYGSQFPANPAVGETFFRTDENKLYVYNGTLWKDISGSTQALVGYGTIFPTNPENGLVFYRTDTNSFWVYTDSGWVTHERVTTSDTPPSGFAGRMYFDTSTNRLMIYHDDQWKPAVVVEAAEDDVLYGSTLPSNAANGIVFIRSSDNRAFVRSNNAWYPIALPRMTTFSGLPTSGVLTGETAYATDVRKLYVHDGSDWRTVHGIRDVTTLPSAADYGDIVYNSAERLFYINISTDRNSPIWVLQDTVRRGTSFPVNPVIGTLFYRTDEDRIYIYNGTAWNRVTPDILVQTGTSFPTNPQEGQPFYRTDQNKLYIYSGNQWREVGGSGGGDGNILVVTSFPSNPQTGQVVYRSDIGAFYVYDGTQWRSQESVSYGATLPAGVDGRMFFRTTDRRLYVYHNNQWRNVAELPYVLASEYSTIEDAVSAALSQNKIVFVPRGTYTWNGQDYGTNSVVIIGEEGAVINLNGTITFSGSGSLYLEKIQLNAVNRGSSVQIFNYTSTQFVGNFILRNVIINTDYNSDITLMPIRIYCNMVFLERTEITFLRPVSGSDIFYIRIDAQNVMIDGCRFSAPVVGNTIIFTTRRCVIYSPRVTIVDSVFNSFFTRLFPISPQSQYMVYRCLFYTANHLPIDYWSNVVVFLGLGHDFFSSEAVVAQCSFYNNSTQKQSGVWGIFVENPLKAIITENYFENVVGVRTAAPIDIRRYNPNQIGLCMITNNVFRNCYNTAMELQCVDINIVKDNDFTNEGRYDLPSNQSYTAQDYGHVIRIRNFIIEDTDNPNPVEDVNLFRVMLLEGNKIKGGLKSAIWVVAFNDDTRHRRMGVYLYNNIIEKVNYVDMLSATEYSRFTNSYGLHNPFRGSAIVVAESNLNQASFTRLRVETKGNRIHRCYHGIVFHNVFVSGSTEGFSEKLLVGDTIIRDYNPLSGDGWDFMFNTNTQELGAFLIKDAYFRSLRANANSPNAMSIRLVNCFITRPEFSLSNNAFVTYHNCLIQSTGGGIINAGLFPVSSVAPSSPTAGSAYFDTSTNTLRVHDGNQWRNASPVSISFGSSFPSSPVFGQMFYRTDEKRLYIWSGTAWVAQDAMRRFAGFPPDRVSGEIWFNTNNSTVYVQTSSSYHVIPYLELSIEPLDINVIQRSAGETTNAASSRNHMHSFQIVESRVTPVGSHPRAIYREGSHPFYYIHFGSTGVPNRTEWVVFPFVVNKPFALHNKGVSASQNDVVLDFMPNTRALAYNFMVLSGETTQTDFWYEQSLDLFGNISALGAPSNFDFMLFLMGRGIPNFTHIFRLEIYVYDLRNNNVTTYTSSDISVITDGNGFFSLSLNRAVSISFGQYTPMILHPVWMRLIRRRSQEAVGSRPSNCYVLPYIMCVGRR